MLKAMAGRPYGDLSKLPKYGGKKAVACKIGGNTASKVRSAHGIAKRHSPEDYASPARFITFAEGAAGCTLAHVQLQHRFGVSLVHPPFLRVTTPCSQLLTQHNYRFCGTDVFPSRRNGGSLWRVERDARSTLGGRSTRL